MLKKIFSILLAAAFLCLPLFPEETQKGEKKESTPQSLKYEVVVTATRLETPTREIASSVTVITREELERTQRHTVLEALQEVLGLTIVQNGPEGGAASVFIRGANSEHTLVMMDGVELNEPISPSRSFDLAHLFVENIERIEILRGPQSTLYGSDALGGVINIITRSGEGRPRIKVTAQGGSYESFTGSTEISGATGRAHYAFSASYFKTQGFSAASTSYTGNSENDGYGNVAISARLGLRLLDSLELDFIGRTQATTIEIDNFGGPYGDDPNNTQKYRASFLKGQLRSLHLRNRWEQVFAVSFVSYNRSYDNPADDLHPVDSETGAYRSNLLNVDWQHNLFLHETNTLTFGFDFQQEQGESEYFSEGAWGPFSSIFPLRKARITGFYVQDQLSVADAFFATAGVRLDYHNQSGRALTYRVAPAYLIKKTGTKIRGTFGTAFKSPSLYQLYAPGTLWGPIGNENLEPEKSKAWDLGIEQRFFQGSLIVAATYFNSSYKNLIFFDFLQGFINIGNASSRGAEFSLSLSPKKGLLLGASYTKMAAKDEDTDTALLRRPKDKLAANLSWSFSGTGNLYVSLVHVGERDDLYYSGWTAERVTVPPYTLINASASIALTKGLHILVRLDNILNARYETVKGYGSPGFSGYGGMRFTF